MSEPKRIQRKRVKGWRKPESAVIVDRTSIFGNPFGVAEFGPEKAKAYFIEWLNGSDRWPHLDERRRRLLARLPELRRKDLVCFCPEDAEWCHADEYLVRVNQE
jgi:hypothetical protein